MTRIAALAFVFAWASCLGSKEAPDAGVPDAGPRTVAEKEPNDRPDIAQPISESTIVSASLAANPSKPDEDWYLLQASSPKTVDLTVSGIPGADVAIEVYDSDRNRVLAVNGEGEGKPERIPNLGVKDKLFVKIFSARRGAGGAYTLTAIVADAAPGYELEPNDRAVDANALPLGQTVSGFIGHANDEDWYRVELPGPDAGTSAPEPTTPPVSTPDAGSSGDAGNDGGVTDAGATVADAGNAPSTPAAPSMALKIQLTGVEGLRLSVSILSAAEAPLFETKTKEGEGLNLRNIGVRPSDRVVYVVVKSAWSGTGKDARRGFNSEKPYSLNVNIEEAGANAELEPNDDIGHATPLPTNGFRQGFISPKGDVDYYVLHSDPPGIYRLQLSGIEHVDLQLSVQRMTDAGTEQTAMRVNDGAIKEPEYLNNLFCAPDCFLRVEAAPRKVDGKIVHDQENPDQPYRLTVTPVQDIAHEEREPNNTAEDATPIALGQPMRGTIQPRRDVDDFKLDLSARPVRTPIKATLLGILKVDVALFLYRLEDDGKLSLVQTSNKGKGDQPEVIRYSAEPGIYVFEVRDTHNRESNFQDSYQLTVEESE